MNLLPHVAASTAAGLAVWGASGEVMAVPVAVAAGVLPDLDHIPDYYMRYVRRDWNYLFLFLHAWEYWVAGLLVYMLWLREWWLLAVLAGYLTQIGGDQMFNKVKAYTYLITVRAIKGFQAKRLLNRTDRKESYMSVVNSLPFGRGYAKRWFEARLPRDGV